MNTTLTTHPDRHKHPQQPPNESTSAPRAVRRVGVIDRVALHLGVALVTWSRRPRNDRHRATAAVRAKHQFASEKLAQARARDEQLYPPFIIR